MEKLSINTNAGNLELTPATTNELKCIAAHWPMGAVTSQAEADPTGLVFQIGDEEALAIKLQPPDTDERTAKALFLLNQALIASALPFYLPFQHQGVMLPCTYYKEKTDGRVESGFAFFASPHPASQPAARTRDEAQFNYDDKLGPGATKMIFDMATAIAKASKRAKLPLNTVIGFDLRPRLALGGLAMHFLIQGPKTFVVQHPLRNEDPVWACAVRAGFSTLSYAPMVPAAVPGPQGTIDAWDARVKILLQRLRT